jgi:hypothetical protein
MPVSETLETAEELRERIGINPGSILANGVYTQIFSKADVKRIEEMREEGSIHNLAKLGHDVGLDLDADDIDTLDAYATFIEGRRAIQGRQMRALVKGAAEPILKLPFLFSAGLELPDLETLADAIEEGITAL